MSHSQFGKTARGEGGAVVIIVAVMLTVLLGLGAIVIDAGVLYSQRRQIQTAADAAALAGVQELPLGNQQAVLLADQYALANYADADERNFPVSMTYVENDTITAELRDTGVALFFARFLGWMDAPVAASATAVISSPTGYGAGVMPFGIMSKETTGTQLFGYSFSGQEEILKQAAAGGESGNFQLLSLTPEPGQEQVLGANIVRNAIRNGGMPWSVELGTYATRPGISGNNLLADLSTLVGTDDCGLADVVLTDDNGVPVVDGEGFAQITDWDCPRLIICPIIIDPGPPIRYNWVSLQGASDPVEVIGFAYFFLTSWGPDPDWDGPPGQTRAEVRGIFLRPLNPEDVTQWGPVDPYGAFAYRLVN